MSLTEDQRFLINHYINLYNNTLRQADVIYENLDHIRRILDYLSVSGMNNEHSRAADRRRHHFSWIPTRTEETSMNNVSQFLDRFQTPVVVAPTQEQIDNAVQRTTFGDIEAPRNVLCPISLEPFFPEHSVAMIRHCGHIFVPGQLASWFTSNVRCPVCRYDIREYPVPRQEQEQEQEPGQQQEQPISSMYNFITTMEYDGDQIIFDVSSSAITDTMTNLSTLLLQDLLRQGIRHGTSLFTDVSFSTPPRR